MGAAELLVEHQRIVVGIEEGEQPDQARNVPDRRRPGGRRARSSSALAASMSVDAEGQGGAAGAARLLALATRPTLTLRDARSKARTRRCRRAGRAGRSRARPGTRRCSGRDRSRRSSRSARHHSRSPSRPPRIALVLFLYRIYFCAMVARGDDQRRRAEAADRRALAAPVAGACRSASGARASRRCWRGSACREARWRRASPSFSEEGWIRRNPGHGHPLRPEYVLTRAGAPIAAFAARVMAQRERLGLEPTQLPRWSLPMVGRLSRRRARFSALARRAARRSRRARLSLTLKQMLATDLVDRALEDEFPPIAIYGLTDRGQRLAEAMRQPSHPCHAAGTVL